LVSLLVAFLAGLATASVNVFVAAFAIGLAVHVGLRLTAVRR